MNEFRSSSICMIKELFSNIINGITLLFLYFTASSIIGNVRGDEAFPAAAWWLVFTALMYLQYFFRTGIKKTIIFLILTLLMPIAVFFLPLGFIAYRIVFTVFAFFYAVYSVFLYTTTLDKLSVSFSPVFTGGIGIVSLFVLHRFNYVKYDPLYVILFLISLSLYFLRMYLDKFVEFINVNLASAAHIPVRNIFKSNSILLSIYVVIGAAIIFVLSSFNFISKVFHGTGEFLRRAIIYLLSLLPEPEEVTTNAEEVVRNELPMGYGDLFVAGEASPVWKYVDLLTTSLVIVLLLALLFFVIKKVYEFVSAKYKKRKPLTVINNTDYEEVHERIEEKVKTVERRRFNLFENFSPSMQIRNLFKKRIKLSKMILTKSGDEDKLSYLTAKDCERILNLKEMADIYEKARYSENPVTSDDVNKMRKICR